MQRLQAATRVARGAAAACGAPQEPAVRAAMSARAAPRKALALRTADCNQQIAAQRPTPRDLLLL